LEEAKARKVCESDRKGPDMTNPDRGYNVVSPPPDLVEESPIFRAQGQEAFD